MSLKRLPLLAAIAVMFVLPGVAYAHEGEDASTDTQFKNSTTAEAIKERIEKRKAELKTKLERSAENRLKARCKAAQTITKTAHTRSDAVKGRRLKAYDNLLSRVTKLVEKLNDNDIDTTDIETAQTELATKLQALRTAVDNYHIALEDTTVIDCIADPVGFKASLDNARTLHEQIGTTYTELRTIIKDTLKPAIEAAKPKVLNQE